MVIYLIGVAGVIYAIPSLTGFRKDELMSILEDVKATLKSGQS